jgi:hypothetical protein
MYVNIHSTNIQHQCELTNYSSTFTPTFGRGISVSRCCILEISALVQVHIGVMETGRRSRRKLGWTWG